MKKQLLPIYIVAALSMGATTLTSCDDPAPIQDLVLARVLSPTNLNARISQEVNIVVTWDKISGATGYEIEAYADTPDYGQRTPDAAYTTTEPQITLTNLMGETEYHIRVRAIDENDASRNSKWVEIARTTNPEQNMNKPAAADIQVTTATLFWTPGLEADAIVCTPITEGEEITHTLTAEEKAAGSATITGLTAETTYNATLKLGTKTRGYTTFTTNQDLGGAIKLSATEDWVTAIQTAEAGTKFALTPGTYTLTDAKLQVNNNLTLVALDPANKPVLNTSIHLNNGAALTLTQVVMDGTGTDGSQAIEYRTDGNFGDLIIEGCEVKNYVKGFIYINVAAVPNAIKIDNSIIHHIECNGGDFIDSRKGGWNNLTLTNSTIYESAGKRDIFRGDNASGVTATMATTVDHCTFYNVGNGAASYRVFYVRLTGNSNTFTNNVVANFNNTRGFANQASTGVPTFANNYYYNCLNLTVLAEGNTQAITAFDTGGKVLDKDPFADAANGNFTVTDELFQSYGFGDPRWRP